VYACDSNLIHLFTVHEFLNFCLGETFVSLSYLFRIGKSTVGEIIPDVCNAIVEVLQDDYLKVTAMIKFSWNSPVVVA